MRATPLSLPHPALSSMWSHISLPPALRDPGCFPLLPSLPSAQWDPKKPALRADD